jgi:chaperone BCS1
VPESLWEWFVSQTTMMITVKDDDAAFVWVKEWFLEQDFLKRIRRLDLDTTLRGEALAMIPAPGRHWFWFGGRPFTVHFYRSREAQGRSSKRDESLTFRTVGRSQEFLRRFVNEVIACHEKTLRLDSALFVFDEYWTRVQGYIPRLLESVILQPGEKERLTQDIARFKASRKRYSDLGVPYHRGYLLYGPPGTGKTSLVSGLAQWFGMSIYLINLNEFNDRTLVKAVNDVPQNSVILFEDIDCMSTGKARAEAGERTTNNCLTSRDEKDPVAAMMSVTLSGLLNVLDGFSAPENVLFVMTTNHYEVLDRALLRPGRIDYRLCMGEASEHQKVELYRRFFPNASELEALEFVGSHSPAGTMAEFQGLLLGLQLDCPGSLLAPATCMDKNHGNRS